jgi:hypothetical protein
MRGLGSQYQWTSEATSEALRHYYKAIELDPKFALAHALNDELHALLLRGYLSEGERGDAAAIQKAIEGVLTDLVFELQSETAERSRARA